MVYALTYCFAAIFIFSFILVPKQSGSIESYVLPRYAIVVFLLFFLGCRGFIITDWFNYYPYFENDVPSLWNTPDKILKFLNNYHWEKGFLIYSIILKSIFPNFFAFQFISTFIDVIFLHYFFNSYVSRQNYAMAFLFFFIFNGISIDVNLLRNSKAFLCFLYSIRFIREKKITKYILCIVVATFFHISSILYFPMYFILNKDYKKSLIIFLFILGNFVYLFYIKWIGFVLKFIIPFFSGSKIGSLLVAYNLISDDFAEYAITIGFLERTLSFILFMFFQNKVLSQNPKILPFFNLMYIFIFIHLYFAEIGVVMERIGYMFIFGYWIVYPEIFNYLKSKKNKEIFLLVLCLYAIVKIVAQCDLPCFSYTNVLLEKQSYTNRARLLNLE